MGKENDRFMKSRSKISRSYSSRTLKILFIRSKNLCAYPKCTHKIVEPPTEQSDEQVIGHVCHIHALSEKGPRWKPGLTAEELNSPENLILLCPTHHRLVDCQHESYPAEELKKWKREHEKIQGSLSNSEPANASSSFLPQLPTGLIDQKIEEEVDKLRKTRFFIGSDIASSSLRLAQKLAEGEFSSGSGSVRSRALAWCVRLMLSDEELLQQAEDYLSRAKNLEVCAETGIAEAFICSRKGDKTKALSILAEIGLPVSKSAALMVVARHEGEQGAIDWLRSAQIDVAELDSEGKYFLLMNQLKLAHWGLAQNCLDSLSNEDLSKEEPALFYMAAMAYLSKAVPDDLLRSRIFRHPPFDAAEFPLDSNRPAIKCRKKARKYFMKAAKIAQKLNCHDVAKTCEEYVLWLDLRNPDKRDEARQLLQAKLRSPESALHLVQLGIQFGVSLNFQAIEREIERQTALHGEITFDAAKARLAVILTRETPEAMADEMEHHQNELERYFDKKSLQFLQIEMLSRAGLASRAKECLETLKLEGISDVEYEYFQDMIPEAEQGDTIEFGKRRFAETDSLNDLRALVNELDHEDRFDDLCEYADILFQRTGSLPDAEKLAKSLLRTRKTGRLVEFIEANRDLPEQSDNLRRSYFSALCHEGELVKARSLLGELNYAQDDEEYRKLRTGLAISSGDWNDLEAFVAEEYSHKNQRTARELITVAELAVLLKLPNAKNLTKLAVEKGGDDAAVLAAAYFLASKAGWENDEEAGQWLQEAVSLSGDNGPMHPVSLKDVLNLKSKGDQRWSETLCQYFSGDLPVFLAAYSSHRSVFDFTFFPAVANLSETDPRRRRLVPAYSGKRMPMEIETDITLGIDATALITLSFLDEELLGKVFDAFQTIRVPHSTLAWLFEEKRKIEFHQPSRIKDARKVRDLLATRKIEELKTAVVPDADLVSQVGDDLAILITEAEKSREADDVQHLVVRSSPVYADASLMDEEADLTAHESVLCGCVSVVDKLRRKGLITDKEKKNAHDYMRIHEKPWPNQPEIADGAVLYLDELTVEYFLRLRMLEKLKDAGFRPVVSPAKVTRANEFLSYEEISGRGSEVIENIRCALNSGIMSGKVRVSRQFDVNKEEEDILCRYLADIFSLTGDCDAIVVDDKCFNQNADISHGDAQASVLSTLDVLDELWSSDFITLEALLDYRTKLYCAGYFFIPVNPRQLRHHIDCSSFKDDKVDESPGLRAIRENILCVRMNDCFQFPKEMSWADTFLTAFILTLKELWTADADLARVRAISDWILESVDILGWFRSLADKNKNNMDEAEFEGQGIVRLLFPMRVSQEILEEYWRWVEDKILVPMKTQRPGLYSWLLKWYRKEISRLVEVAMAEEPEMKDPYSREAWVFSALRIVPMSFQDALLRDPDFRREHGLKADQVVSFGSPAVLVRLSELCGAVRKVFSGISGAEVVDDDGQKWEIRDATKNNAPKSIALFQGDREYALPPSFISLFPEREVRLNFLEEAAWAINLSGDVKDSWRKIFEKRALKDGEVEAFESDIVNTPANIEQSIRRDIHGGGRISSWVPSSEKYFDRLIGEYDGSASIRDYASNVCGPFFQKLSEWRPYEGFLFSLFLSSHPALAHEIQTDRLDDDNLIRAFEFLEDRGDRISQIGAIEVGLRILPSKPEIEPYLIRLIRQIVRDDAGGEASGFKLLSALFFFVDGELSRTRLLSSKPPFYRRLAALSQASMIHRQLVNSNVDIELLCENLFRDYWMEHYIQSLVDMRVEPGWNPVFDTAENIRANFLYRIITTPQKHKRETEDGNELYEIIFGTEPTSVLSAVSPFFFSYLNPLDGTGVPRQEVPAAISSAIEKQINMDQVSQSSFATLVNSAYLFHLGSDHAELASKALRSCGYRISNLESREQLVTLLNGLSMVAAVTGSEMLANELRILVRGYRKDPSYKVSIGEELLLCLTAAANHSDLDEWKEFVGNWITETSFESEVEDADIFRSQLQYLCHIVPELWLSCDRAYAALNAVPRSG